LLVFVPEHTNGDICEFSKYKPLFIQDIVIDVVKKGL
jgi:hypothetical protein